MALTKATTDVIADSSVTTAKLADSSATPAKGGTGQNFSTTAQGSTLYFSGTGTVAALAPGTSGQFLKTQGAGANPTWANATLADLPAVRFKVLNSTHDLSTASGTKAIPHGVSGTPKAVILLAAASDSIATAIRRTTGVGDGTAHGYEGTRGASSPFFAAGAKLGYSLIDGSNYVAWDSASFDATNVTLSFTKTGSPTGTDALRLLVFF